MRIKINNGQDQDSLRAALDAAGYDHAALVSEGEDLFIETPEGADAMALDTFARGHYRRSMVVRVRKARPGTAALQAAVADALEELLRL
jgi:hypothetical protein